MPYFNPGDVVHIRSDLEDLGFSGQDQLYYTVKGPDGLGDWCWTDEMFDEYIHRESEQQLVAEGDESLLEFISANKI